MEFNKKVFVISGPTASGKSYLAEELLKQNIPAVILNADSMQIYKDLPILSGQPDIQGEYHKYQLYNFLEFDENYSVGLWHKAIHKAIQGVFEKNKVPVVIGGTGLYIKALLEGIPDIPEIAKGVKGYVRKQFLELGKARFYAKLASVDIVAAKNINSNDTYRMQRAMEVYLQTGDSIRNFKNSGHAHVMIHISLMTKRKKLYEKCDLRFKEMLKAGAKEEVKLLFEKLQGLPGTYNIKNTLGYRSIVSYLIGELSFEEIFTQVCQATRNYAKRQCTWFKNQFPNKILLPYASDINEIKEKFLKIVDQQLSIA